MKSILLSVLLASVSLKAFATEPPHVRGELLASVTSIAPGDSFTAALVLDMDPGWHTYWINPGDSGAAPEMEWQLPGGVVAGDLRYPAPERIPYGPLMNYGYHHQVSLPFSISLAPDFKQTELDILGQGQVLVCADVCIPQPMSVSLTLPVGTTAIDASHEAFFLEAASRLPVPLEIPTSLSATEEMIRLTLALPGIEENRISSVAYFPFKPDLIDNPEEQTFRMTSAGLEVSLVPGFAFDADNPDISGVLVVHEKAGTGLISSFEITFPDENASTGTTGTEVPAFLVALGFAFLGGLILNLMPCVFPVLSIKILSLVESVHEEGGSIRRHGWAYVLGVVASFLAIAGLLTALRAGGEAIGWGFQLQSPVMVSLLVFLFLIISLNLAGVLEFSFSISDTGRRGYSGSALTGVLATIVAAPCTAPFMGVALGYALLQSPLTGIFVFAALGFGMAAPYLLLCYSPLLLERLPRPGNWMLVLRQCLAFPMLASAIWLLWVLGLQAGPTAMMQVLGAGLIIAFAAWLRGQGRHWLLRLVSVLLLLAAVSVALVQKPQTTARSPDGESSQVRIWSEEAVEEARMSGPVFVNFTAAWCITCKVNEINALETEAVRNAFIERGVIYFKADWTSEDPKITAALQLHGRTGVPLYLLYAQGSGKARVLPQLLTPTIVLNALSSL